MLTAPEIIDGDRGRKLLIVSIRVVRFLGSAASFCGTSVSRFLAGLFFNIFFAFGGMLDTCTQQGEARGGWGRDLNKII